MSPAVLTASGIRSACERCRSHKLRCVRDNSETSCVRCLRSNASCTTNRRLRLGRPSRIGTTTSDAPQELPVNHQPSSATSTSPSTSATIHDRTASTATSPPSSISLESLPSTQLQSPLPQLSFIDSLDFAWQASDDQDPGRMLPGSADSLGQIITSQIGDASGLEWEDAPRNVRGTSPDLSSPEPWLSGVYSESCVADAPSLSGTAPDLTSTQNVLENESGDLQDDTMVKIISLNKRIYKHFQRLDRSADASWNFIANDTSNGAAPNGRPSQIGEILRISQEFLNTLHDYVKCSRGLAGESDRQFARHYQSALSATHVITGKSISSPDPVLTLQIIGCYLNLIRIHCNLFSRIRREITNSPLSCHSTLLALPGLEISGFPIQSSELQIMVLFQAVSGLLIGIERAIGVPTGYCVCVSEEYSSGILSDVDSNELFVAVLKQEERSNRVNDRGGVKALREHFKIIRSKML